MDTHPITGFIGAEITNINLAKVTSEEVQAIKEEWLKHKVLVFRDQNITREEHIAFGKNFGKLEIHPFAPHPKEYPEIVKIISNDKVGVRNHRWDQFCVGGPSPKSVVIPRLLIPQKLTTG